MIAKYSLNSVRKFYGSRLALDVSELTLLPQRIYVLTGPNGSGKSTLLNILAFLTPPDAGEIAFAGQPVAWRHDELFRLRQKVTLLHQAPYLFAGTVFSNVAFGLKARGIRGEKLRQRVADGLRLVGLTGFESRDVKQLSGGEAQRVALARALVLNPEVLLVDEPLASVDKASAEVLETVIASLPVRGATVVMATHDQSVEQRLNGTLIRLSQQGRIEHVGGAARADTTPSQRPEFGEAGKPEGARWSASKMHVN
jgi:tungstate transport system ATP-binding protein